MFLLMTPQWSVRTKVYLGSFFLDKFFLKDQIASPFLKIKTNAFFEQVGKWIVYGTVGTDFSISTMVTWEKPVKSKFIGFSKTAR